PSLTSAFHGCLPCPSSLFLRKTVPSIVGVEKVILSPFVARFVAGIPNFTRYNQKYRYFPFAFFALKPIATGSPPSSLVDIKTWLSSIVAPVKSLAAAAPISSIQRHHVPLRHSLLTSAL